MKFSLVCFILFHLLSLLGLAQTESSPLWYRGNTHTHTLNSDGDSTPDEVVGWYREQGYHFVVLTDHEFVTPVEGLNSVYGARDRFLVIAGEEISDEFEDTPLHVNGLNLGRVVDPQGGISFTDTLQRNVDAVRAVGGIPQINHPNYRWSVTAKDLIGVKNCLLLEIYSGHPYVNHLGGNGRPGVEEIWDTVLSSGRLIYGVAAHDAHDFKKPWDATAARPGGGWVMVRAAELKPEAIFAAMERGDFYATTGVELEDYRVSHDRLEIYIRKVRDTGYRVQFIGQDGLLLSEVQENPAMYLFTGSERYVRARVLDSNGKIAWLQPVFLKSAAKTGRSRPPGRARGVSHAPAEFFESPQNLRGFVKCRPPGGYAAGS